jgi:non-heme chloroperoxidase
MIPWGLVFMTKICCRDGELMSKTIVMIHGMFVGPWCWGNYVRHFEDVGYQCITPALRFHDMDPDDSPNPQVGKTSLLDYAEDLEKELGGLDAKPILMGHSMGGLLAQILGSRGLAKALVLLTPASPYGVVALKPSVIRAFWSGFTKWGFWRRPIRPTDEEAASSALNLVPPGEREGICDKLVYESGRAASEIGFWLLDSKKAAKVEASKITVPVLVIAGTHDRLTPASVVRKVAEKYRGVSTYKEFQDHAHWVLGEPGWEKIAAYVCEWLNRLVQPPNP